jgi:hypothetical protein
MTGLIPSFPRKARNASVSWPPERSASNALDARRVAEGVGQKFLDAGDQADAFLRLAWQYRRSASTHGQKVSATGRKAASPATRQNRRAGSPPASFPLSSGPSPFGRLNEAPHTPAMDRQPVPRQNPNNSFRAFARLSPSCNCRPFDELRSAFAYRFQCLVIQEARIVVFLAPSELRGSAQPRKISIYL